MARFAATAASPGRGSYAEARAASDVLDSCRRRLCGLLGGAAPERIIFTLNATDALNLAIKGVVRSALRRGLERPHVLATALDHNSVLRPFAALEADGTVESEIIPCDPVSGLVDPDDISRAITPRTCLVAVVHGSNVSGTVQPIPVIAERCRSRSVPLLVDAAQTLGHRPIDVAREGIDLLAFPGHKGLLGPSGTGGLYIAPGVEERMETVREGGTGSRSERAVQPDDLPDRFEAGSHNAIGIAGLDAALGWIAERTVAALHAHERRLVARLLDGLSSVDGVRVLGPASIEDRCGVVSIVFDEIPALQAAERMEREHGILVRAGLHCAPYAHRTFGTDIGGAVRLSVGPFLDESDVDAAIDGVGAIARRPVGAVR